LAQVEEEMVRKALVGILLVCLMIEIVLISMSVCVAKESTSLPASPFLKVEIRNLGYDKVYGTEMVRNGSEVSIKVVFTNISKELDESTLSFYSELVGEEGHIIDKVLKSGGSYKLDHQKAGEEVIVSWLGEAPDVRKRTTCTLLNIIQETTEGKYPVIDIAREVSSEAIEDAVIAINKANESIAKATLTIANASKAGIEASDAETSLELANEHLNNSQSLYNEGRPEGAIEEAVWALDFAKEAEDKARAALKSFPLPVTPTPTPPVLPISPEYLYAIPIALFLFLLPFIFYIRGKRKKPATTSPEKLSPPPEQKEIARQKVKEQEQISIPISESITLERTIYDPCKRDFVEKPLPRMKEWINRYDPGAYWFALSIQNNTDRAIEEWGVELETSAALKISEAKIEGIEIEIPHEAHLGLFKILVPKEYGIVIPKGGTQRVYFKLHAEKPKTTYEIRGVFKSIIGEVPIRPKEFKYLCDAWVSPEAVKAELKKIFSEKDAARLANSFRIVQDIRSIYCNTDTTAREINKEFDLLEMYLTEKEFLDEIESVQRRINAELREDERLDGKHVEAVKDFCVRFTEMWIARFLR
jgi:hypothetical protein